MKKSRIWLPLTGIAHDMTAISFGFVEMIFNKVHFRPNQPIPGEAMEVKLYVGNLPYSATEEQLRELFTQAGTVASVALIIDRDTGRSKGFAFIEMSTQVEAQKAISQFNGYMMDGRALAVNAARPSIIRGGGCGRPGGNDRRRSGGGGGERRY
jgi:cold-inducible RNA-binding protein